MDDGVNRRAPVGRAERETGDFRVISQAWKSDATQEGPRTAPSSRESPCNAAWDLPVRWGIMPDDAFHELDYEATITKVEAERKRLFR